MTQLPPLKPLAEVELFARLQPDFERLDDIIQAGIEGRLTREMALAMVGEIAEIQARFTIAFAQRP